MTTKEQSAPEGQFQLSQYFTKGKSNEGVKLFLSLPDGTPTTDYFIVAGTDSDTFRRAMAKAQRMGMEIAALPEEERDDAIYDQTVRVCAACILSWSFDAECTDENKYELLSNARYLKEMVDVNIKNRALFFGQNSTNS